MKKVLAGIATMGLLASAAAAEVDFSECKELNPAIARVQSTPSIEGLSATWQTEVGVMRCDVDAQNKVVQFVGEQLTISRERAMQLAEDRKKREKVRSGEFTSLIEDTRNWFKSELKDPYSAVFEDVYVYRDTAALCGKVNAKNSHGAFVGLRPFYFANFDLNGVAGDSTNGMVAEKMLPAMCRGEGEKIAFSIDGSSKAPPLDMAEQIRKLSDLHKDGVLSKDEFETAKKRLISGN